MKVPAEGGYYTLRARHSCAAPNGATGNTIRGNLIGSTIDGTATLPNTWDGIYVYKCLVPTLCVGRVG